MRLLAGPAALALLLLCASAPAAAAETREYWLRLQDLRIPRPPADEREPPRPREAAKDAAKEGARDAAKGAAKGAKGAAKDGGKDAPKDAPKDGPSPQGAEAPTLPPADTAEPALAIGGDYKLLAARSRTPDVPGAAYVSQAYSQLLARLRLKVSYRFLPSLDARVEHDTDLTAGSYVRTGYFQAHKDERVPQVWSSGSTFADGRDAVGTQQFHRAYLKWRTDVADLTLGRQRIPLGVGRFWSTIDMLNPINPLQIERDEFKGVDAVLVERGVGALSKFSAVYAPDPAHRDDRWALQFRTHARDTDLSFTYGRYWKDQVIGADFATQGGDAGLRGELTYTRPEIGAAYGKALVGFDYGFENSLTLSAEAYYSDRSAADRDAQWAANPQLRFVQPYSNAYAGLALGYEFTPLLKLSAYVLKGLKGNGRMFYPALTYSLDENTSLMGGAQVFLGDQATEYGRGKNLYFARFQRFF